MFKTKKKLPTRIELVISSLQDWCLTIMALEALTFLPSEKMKCYKAF
jgi:hypothetical protein